MSSILKALKKVETERSSSGKDRPWLTEIQAKEPMFDRLMGGWITHQRVFAVWAAVLLCLAGVAVIIFRAGFFGKFTVPVLAEKQQTARYVTGPLLESKVPAKTAVSIVPMQSTAVQTLLQNQPQPESPVVLPQKSYLSSPATEVEASLLQQPAAEPILRETAKTPSITASFQNTQTAEETTDDKIPENLPSEPTAAVQTLNDPMMKLQAVSWSLEPEKRLAVINNRIVRQGARIDTYLVVKINKDDVIVEQGEEMWKIPFRPR